MFEIRQVRELRARKALLISECSLDRNLIAAEAAVFERKTRWPVLLFAGVKALLPRLQFLLPVAGWLISRGLNRRRVSSGSGIGPRAGASIVGLVRKGMVAWQLFKKGRQLWLQWRGQRGIRPLKPVI